MEQTERSGEPRPGLLVQILISIIHYVHGQILISLIMTLLYAAGFYWIGVPLWWLLSLICGPLHLIPILGSVLSVALPLLAIVIAGGGLKQVLFLLLLYAGVQALETFYLTPKILGRKLRLHPVIVFFAVLLGALVSGPVGALLAAPIAAILLIVYRHVRPRASSRALSSKDAQN